mgnify:CR=1 FL=1
MNRVLYILFIVLSLSGCKMQMANMGVEEALSKAGGNRKELFQVIRHYQDSGDSLKLKAALFLIENMADKYYLTGNVIDEYYTFIDSVYQIKQPEYEIVGKVLPQKIMPMFSLLRLHVVNFESQHL